VVELRFDIHIYNSLNIELKEIWNKFELESSYSAFQSFSWVEAWYDNIGSDIYDIVLQIVVVKNEGVIYGIFPLSVRKLMRIRILEWIGGINSDYLGPLLCDDWKNVNIPFLKLWDKIDIKIQKYDVMHLVKQAAKISDIDNPFVSEFNSRHNRSSYQAILDITWNDFQENKIKNKIIADIRRQKKRLAKLGEVEFLVADSNLEKRGIINEMIKQKKYRYHQTGEWNMLSIYKYELFYEKLALIDSDVIKIHCSSLSVGNKLIATHVGLVCGNRYYYIMPSNEYKDWGKYSPGKVLLEYLIKWSIDNGFKIFDFTIGDESYKQQWCDVKTDLYETFNVVTFKGWIYMFLWKTKDKLNKYNFGKTYLKRMKRFLI
jgi:CelD/BcsL family acetyltransferase involved in cellulose biosynthesis